MDPSCSLPNVYQFRVVVQGISPLIWRRLLIRSDMSLATLHAALQVVFAWSNTYLKPLEYPASASRRRASWGS
jgi:Plasmid pRiA4b ORF-3-like protein